MWACAVTSNVCAVKDLRMIIVRQTSPLKSGSADTYRTQTPFPPVPPPLPRPPSLHCSAAEYWLIPALALFYCPCRGFLMVVSGPPTTHPQLTTAEVLCVNKAAHRCSVFAETQGSHRGRTTCNQLQTSYFKTSPEWGDLLLLIGHFYCWICLHNLNYRGEFGYYEYQWRNVPEAGLLSRQWATASGPMDT